MLRVRLERGALKSAMSLPEKVCTRLASRLGVGKKQSMLDARLRLLLAASQTKKPLNERSVPDARAFYGEMFDLLDVPESPSVSVREHSISTGDDEISLRSYHPDAARRNSAMPGLLFMHGGGFTIGCVEDYHHIVSWMAEKMQVTILSLDYRLGPEHPFPTAAEDAIAAWQWVCANTDQLGLNPERLGVMGDSAGGNLSAVISQQSKRRGLRLPSLQCLIYPVMDQRMTADSISRYSEGFGLTMELIKWFRSHYLESVTQASELLASPGLEQTEKLAGQPTTVLITATDPLRDEGLDYGNKLRKANCQVTHLDYPQLVHGFVGMCGVLPAARLAMEEICLTLAEQL